jgi:uncharacterized protein HemX
MSIPEKQSNPQNKILKTFNLFLVVILVVSGFYFLKSMDDAIVKNLELEQLKGQIGFLENENREIQVLKNNLESYENISSRLKDMNMVKITDIKYIEVSKDSLAKK